MVRSRSIAIEVTTNIVMNGSRPSIGRADALEHLRAARRRRSASAPSARQGTTISRATVRGSRRSWRSTRSAMARWRARSSGHPPARSAAGRPRRDPRRRSAARSASGVSDGDERRPRASAAAGRTRPPRPSRGSRRGAWCPSRRQGVERAPEVAPQHRVEARPWARPAPAAPGSPSRATASDTRVRWPPGHAPHDLAAAVGEADRLQRRARRRRAGAPTTRAKWRRFSRTVRSAYTEGAWVT